jgi:hypothetical protein
MDGAECKDVRNGAVLAFLRSQLTPAEQAWPRFAPRLRAVGDVPLAELRTHPDLSSRLRKLAPPAAADHLQMLMGAPVLVTPSGLIYAVGFGMDLLVLRLGGDPSAPAGAPAGIVRAAPAAELGPEWVAVDVWLRSEPKLEKQKGLVALGTLVERAWARAESGGPAT